MRDPFPTFRRFGHAALTRVFWRSAAIRAAALLLAVALLGFVSNLVSRPACTRLVRTEIVATASLGEAPGRLMWLPEQSLFIVSPSGYREGVNRPIAPIERLSPSAALVLPKAAPRAPWAFAYPRFWPGPFVVRVHYGFDGGPLWSEAGYYELVVFFGRVVSRRQVAQFLT